MSQSNDSSVNETVSPSAYAGDVAAELIDETARKRFESDWHPRKLGEIESYLPEPGDQKYWATLEELLYIDLEFSWKAYESLPDDATVSVNQSPTVRLKSISNRLQLDQKRDLLQRLWDYEQSLRDKSKKRKKDQNRTGDWETLKSVGATDSSTSQGLNKEFGDYRLMEPLGRGGMGVVYKATENKTGRQVALKMIRSNMVTRVDDETRRIVMERFQNEAKAVANIEHPNIVTLFDVGVHDQTPYLSMQLVQGDDLASRIRLSVLDCKAAASYIRQVATAIEAAHENGIIHRDLKPHNILLDEKRNIPLVTDFGLAKLTDEKDGLTETGELLGTPGYMSPEQAVGKPVDEATDIYSLGATLYCLVGGRPPFQASDTIKTIEQIVKNPPIEPREVNPDVDSDLNTICLKCLEKDPSRRYSSAKKLAEDLERYLNGEPILARPVGPVERSIRWCRRNPLPTTIGMSLMLMIVLAVSAFFISNYYRNQAIVEKVRSDANADIAFDSNREELFLISEDQSLKLPGMLPTRKGLLMPLKDFFDDFIEINENYENVKVEFAFAHFALGKILHELNDSELATDYLSRAIKIQREIVEESPKDERSILDLSNSLNLRGECSLKLGSPDDAITDFQLALRWRKQLVDQSPSTIEYRRKLANTEMNLGNWWAYQGDPDSERKAIEYFNLSIKTRDRYLDSILGSGSPAEFNTKYDQAKCEFNLAASNINVEKGDIALVHAKNAMKIFGELHDIRPSYFFVIRDKARCAQVLASVDMDRDPGLYYAEIADAFIHITKLYPSEKQYRWLAVDALNYLGDLKVERAAEAAAKNDQVLKRSEFESARRSYQIAWDLINEQQPNSDDQKMLVVAICFGSIPVHLEFEENKQARSKLQMAEKILKEDSITKHPGWKEKNRLLGVFKTILGTQPDPDI